MSLGFFGSISDFPEIYNSQRQTGKRIRHAIWPFRELGAVSIDAIFNDLRGRKLSLNVNDQINLYCFPEHK